jgi:TRAP-type C4-dicarboxylate transport system permease small subunit
MLEWMIDGFFSLLKSFPALWTDEGSANFMLVRAMLGLLLIVLIAYLIAMRPFRSALANCMKKLTNLFARH